MTESLNIPAIKYTQGSKQDLYSFVVNGKDIPRFANITRVGRKQDKSNELFGYQRPEVYSHIKDIQKYLESGSPLMPNALVVAFVKKVKFSPFRAKKSQSEHSTSGILTLPTPEKDEDRIGWIVDGQQRTAAIRDALINEFPIAVVGFIASEAQQREQFILVNSTKPLPKDLIYELLPSTESRLSLNLEKRKLPALLANELNFPADFDTKHCPFAGKIKTPTNPNGYIAYNSVLKMLENSISDGILMRSLANSDGHPNIPVMIDMINKYWLAVSIVFARAWNLPPSKSRLTHGAGMTSMGFLMDTIFEYNDHQSQMTTDILISEISKIADECAWTEGNWKMKGNEIPWNSIQNLPKDIESLTNHILKNYITASKASQ